MAIKTAFFAAAAPYSSLVSAQGDHLISCGGTNVNRGFLVDVMYDQVDPNFLGFICDAMNRALQVAQCAGPLNCATPAHGGPVLVGSAQITSQSIDAAFQCIQNDLATVIQAPISSTTLGGQCTIADAIRHCNTPSRKRGLIGALESKPRDGPQKRSEQQPERRFTRGNFLRLAKDSILLAVTNMEFAGKAPAPAVDDSIAGILDTMANAIVIDTGNPVTTLTPATITRAEQQLAVYVNSGLNPAGNIRGDISLYQWVAVPNST